MLVLIIKARDIHADTGEYPATPNGPHRQGFDDWAAEVVEAFIAQRCVYPGCENSRRTRGLCHGHYQAMRSKVRAGKAAESDLEARGLLMPKGTGGTVVNGHDAFLIGSKVEGDAA